MSDHSSGYKHDASDKKLDHAADAAKEAHPTTDAGHSADAGHHDADKIRKHDDPGKDRLFEHREQRDDAEKQSEKTRLARDVARHDHDHEHPVADDAADAGTGANANGKS